MAGAKGVKYKQNQTSMECNWNKLKKVKFGYGNLVLNNKPKKLFKHYFYASSKCWNVLLAIRVKDFVETGGMRPAIQNISVIYGRALSNVSYLKTQCKNSDLNPPFEIRIPRLDNWIQLCKTPSPQVVSCQSFFRQVEKVCRWKSDKCR